MQITVSRLNVTSFITRVVTNADERFYSLFLYYHALDLSLKFVVVKEILWIHEKWNRIIYYWQ